MLAMLSRGVTWLWRTFASLKNFLDDWQGEAARPGVAARPGFPQRITTIEEQLRPNHGTSLRDAVDRLERGVRRVEDGLAAHLDQHQLAGTISIINNSTDASGSAGVTAMTADGTGGSGADSQG
ncbi:hypothetical protein ACFQX6_10895 [Streptosporangium lutulentum]